MTGLIPAAPVFFAVALALAAPPSPPAAPDAPFVAGELLVKFHSSAAAVDRAGLRGAWNARSLRRFAGGAEHWRLGPGRSVEAAIAALRDHPHLEYAEPNYLVHADVVPDDPDLIDLWALINTGQTGGTADADIDADAAWGVTTGSAAVVVAVIDSGIDSGHPDLAANLWVNPAEIAGNGFDDDGNGLVDDVNGWDFVQHDNAPEDPFGHGTHVAGTIGAIGDNGIGIAGVNWVVRLMPLRFLNAAGSGSVADAVAAIDYAVAAGADILNNSWGGGWFSQTLFEAIARADAAGVLFVASAGNASSNNDITPHFPSGYDLPNVIAVTATDHNDQRDPQANFGPVSVDLGAPGTAILSTLPGGLYGTASGTSMAAPHVSGVAALLRAAAPAMPAAQIRSRLLGSVDPVPALAGITAAGGRLNAAAALDLTSCANDNRCDDGLFCSGEEFCAGGVCVWGEPPCDDLDPCTADSCDESVGSCTNAAIPDGEIAAGPDGLCNTADDQIGLYGPDGTCGAATLTGDGWCDAVDNCPAVHNPDQIDTDGDGFGDRCDPVPCRRPVSLTSSLDYLTSGAATNHFFDLPALPVGAGSVEAIVEGDYNGADEFAVAFIEGAGLGNVGDQAGTGICTVDADTFSVSAANLSLLAADGTVHVGLINTAAVGSFCITNRHSVTLRYTGELRLAVPGAIEAVEGGVVVVPVTLTDVTGLGITQLSTTVRFNPAVIQPIDVRTGPLATGFLLGSDFSIAGEVSFDLSGAVPLAGAGTVAEIEFAVAGLPQEGSPVEIISAVLNGGSFQACRQPGGVTVVACGNGGPPAGIADLAVSEFLLSWDSLAESEAYDLIRGDLNSLRTSGGDFTIATSDCLADDLVATQLNESTLPAPGQGTWFLLRGVNCRGTGSYDSGSATQAGSRDQEVESSGAGCP